MNRQLYQMGGPIEEARSFFMNRQGLSPDQADMIVSQGLQAYNQQTQPQSMMQMASNGGRIGYAFGKSVSAFTAQPGGSVGQARGIGGMMQKLIQKNPQMFRPVNNQQTLLNASSLNRDFIDINENGIDDREEASNGGRIGLQMGGISNMSMQPMMSNPMLNYGQTPLMMQGGGIARLGYQMGGEADMGQMGGIDVSQIQGKDVQQALETIIQLLIQQGIDPETALQLASQIIQIFAQGGEPAVEAFANQLEQEEQMQMMAGGGIAGYAQRQGYFLGKIVKAAGKVFKSIGKAVKSVAKSPLGRAALTIGAATFLGPGAFGISGLGLGGLQLGLATAAANLGLQKIGGQKLNFLEAGLSGLSAGLSNPAVPTETLSGTTVNTIPVEQANLVTDVGLQTQPVNSFSYGNLPTGEFPPPANVTAPGQQLEKAFTEQARQVGQIKPTGIMAKAQEFGTNLINDPMKTISNLAGSAYDKIADNIIPLTGGTFLGKYFFGSPQQPDEPDDDFAKRQQEEANASITQFGRNLQIRNPYFYARYGAEDPFAVKAANGGIMGYAAGGSMVPPARRIEGGIIELDARKSGGYIPYGKKERVDDVPAMLAKDEFVFTSRAVKAAGGGSARRGAAKMYKMMKQLEAKGMKMERGARA